MEKKKNMKKAMQLEWALEVTEVPFLVYNCASYNLRPCECFADCFFWYNA